MNKPLYHEIPYGPAFPLMAFLSEKHKENLLFLDSNAHEGADVAQRFPTGRYSYIGFDPKMVIETRGDITTIDGISQTDKPFDCIQRLLKLYQLPKADGDVDLPPFQGGFAGYFGYGLLHTLENIPHPIVKNPSPEIIDDMHLCFYDMVFAFDHRAKRAWLFSMTADRLDYAHNLYNARAFSEKPLMAPPLETLHCDSTRSEFEASIQKTLDYIVAGDIFQANITRRLFGALPQDCDLVELYHRLRSINPAPFSGFLQWNVDEKAHRGGKMPMALLSSSPERFIRLEVDGHMETRPIKGTRRRSQDLAEDAKAASELLASTKDRAENIMIVDLMRNDISRVAKPFSVKEPAVCALESYETVHHLVSTVVGQLKDNHDAIDVLKATFPGGSITGAPKVRAMEIISELEPANRGPYCGSLGYIGLDGAMDTSIMIRTLVVCGDEISFHVGGGIVADSNPSDEFDETVTKARALAETLTGKGCV